MDLTGRNFGIVISLLLPGYLLLWGLSYSVDSIASLLVVSKGSDTTTIGGALYATLASLSLGMLISAVRWAVVDLPIQWAFGLNTNSLDFSKLKDKDTYAAFQGVVEAHYRYYQFYSNSLVVVLASFIAYLSLVEEWPSCVKWVLILGLCGFLLFAAIDCFKKYNSRAKAILT